MGSPYFLQENMQKLLGESISASTIYDQCAHLAAIAEPIMAVLMGLAANAGLFHIDDTGNRILDQKPIEKPNRRGKGTRTRSGIYTSGVIAVLENGFRIVLFQTNIGHAGEWIDEILAKRDSALPPPTVMSDALSCNKPTVPCNQALCNSHSRRKHVDVVKNFPDEVEFVVSTYAGIWKNDDDSKALNHSPEQRRDYHAEHSLSVMETLKDWGEAQINGDDLSSLIATCELNGVNAYDYLIAIQRYRQEVSRHSENWLPGTYREAIDKRENQAA
ncbi:MAG: transposase [Exilibacterium sp.]